MTDIDPSKDPLHEMLTLRDVMRRAVSSFHAHALHFGHGTDNAWDEARWLVLGALHLPFDSPDWVLDGRIDTAERARLSGLLLRRIVEHVPTAYLLGEAWFCGLRFRVDPRVLIPRSPIGELIEAGFEPWLGGHEPARILDLCCGSGCIGIAAALRFPDAEVVLSDIDPGALELARENVQLHGLGDRVHVVESDLFAALAGETFDLILTNPPYVDGPDMASLPPEFAHEPRLALAAGGDGLDFARPILAAAREHLTPEGLLVLEVGNSAEALEAAYPGLSFVWPEFARGGSGVAILEAGQIMA